MSHLFTTGLNPPQSSGTSVLTSGYLRCGALRASEGRVYGFELAAKLHRTLRLPPNDDLNISWLCLAVSDQDSNATFQISKFSRWINKLKDVGEWQNNQASYR